MIASVALGKKLEDAKPTQCMLIDVELCGTHGKRKLFALLDTGAQGNFLSQRVAIEEGLQADPTSIGAMSSDGHSIVVYGKHAVDTVVTDSQGESRSSLVDFIATDIQKYDAILGWPWIYHIDPNCRFKLREWSYREQGYRSRCYCSQLSNLVEWTLN